MPTDTLEKGSDLTAARVIIDADSVKRLRAELVSIRAAALNAKKQNETVAREALTARDANDKVAKAIQLAILSIDALKIVPSDRA